VIELFPDSSRVVDGRLELGALPASTLAERFGTPLLVLCEQTLRARAREARAAVPGGLVAYGTKALPSVAVLRLFAEEALGADVASLGELAYARAAGHFGEQLIVHGNNKSDEELEAATEADATVVLDGADEGDRAGDAGVARVLVRITLGVEADTHEAIRTGHHGSKFGLPPDEALALLRRSLGLGLDVAGLHVHVGSQLADEGAQQQTIRLLAGFASRCRGELGWTPRLVDAGGGFPVRHVPGEPWAPLGELAARVAGAVLGAWAEHGLPEPRIVIEPGRALVGQAGVTLYRVGAVKRLAEITWVMVDGGMSDNPRPQLYGARYGALLADRADEAAAANVSVAGLHCESGDVLIDDVALPEPRRGDLLAVPATGAYTLAMASNYNGVPRPAAVLVGGGDARLIRRRETVADLLALESG
jgi:diaminopimelate decarboxylase